MVLAFKKPILIILLSVLLLPLSLAKDYYFDGGSGFGSDWNNIGNWRNLDSPGLHVGSDDNVNIEGDCTILLLSEVTVNGQIWVASHVDLIVKGSLKIEDDAKVLTKPNGHNFHACVTVEGSMTISHDSELNTSVTLRDGASFTNAGLCNFWECAIGVGTMLTNGGACMFRRPIDVFGLILNSGSMESMEPVTISLGGNLYNSGEINFESFVNAGTIINRPSGDMSFEEQSSNIILGNITNESGGSFEVGNFVNEGSIENQGSDQPNGPAEWIVNGAFVNKWLFSNFGKVRVSDGGDFTHQGTLAHSPDSEIDIFGKMTLDVAWGNGGNISVEDGGDLVVDSGVDLINEKNLFIQPGGSFTNHGTCNNRGSGNFQVRGVVNNNGRQDNSANLFIDVNGIYNHDGSLLDNAVGGTLGVSGTLNSNGLLGNSGDFDTYSQGHSKLGANTANAGDLLITGTMEILSTGTLTNAGTIDNKNSLMVKGELVNDNLTDNDDGTITVASSGKFTNNDEFNNFSSGDVQCSGELHSASGSMHSNNGTFSFGANGIYTGVGSITGGMNTMDGTIAPGLSPGTITQDGFLTFLSSGTYEAEIASATSHDLLDVNGAQLGGATLDVSFLEGYSPPAGTQIEILSTNPSSRFGTFGTVNIPSGFEVVYTDDAVLVQRVVLPIELVAFDGEVIDQEAHLNWSTATELNNEYFEIQRQSQRGSWHTISSVPGQGDSNKLLSYTYIDRAPPEGRVQYRIKQVDLDGQFSYSPIISLTVQRVMTLAIAPNPASQHVVISGLEADAQLQVFDSSGRPVLSGQVTSDNIRLQVGHWASGIYHVQIFRAGNKQMTRRLVVTH